MKVKLLQNASETVIMKPKRGESSFSMDNTPSPTPDDGTDGLIAEKLPEPLGLFPSQAGQMWSEVIYFNLNGKNGWMS